MMLPNKKDAIHKAWLYRLLSAIADVPLLARLLYFKGGTCAAMLGYLDRFSIDLVFDFMGDVHDVKDVQEHLEIVFQNLGLMIKDKSQNVPQYFLKYPARENERNTIQIDATMPPAKANRYAPKRFHEIDRIITCQTLETMFANKLVAVLDRYQKTRAVAGRDIYDIHHFFLQGFRYTEAILNERTGKGVGAFLEELIAFIEANVTDTIITQDLNVLLSYQSFKKIRKILKREVLMFLRDELA